MKRFLAWMVVCMLLATGSVLAEDMGVQIIGAPVAETEPVSLDDMKVGVAAEIDGYGKLEITSFAFVEKMGYYRQGISYVYYDDDYNWSGAEAEYALIYMDILNTTPADKNFLEQVAVKAVYNEDYEYGGWAKQLNYNNSNSRYGDDADKQNKLWGINKADQFAIGPMYEGHYAFGCTLPNAVVEGSEPLCIIITIDGNELTYHIRK